MKERFRDKLGLNKFNIVRLGQINSIIDEYSAEGYRLTLRQLYYQLVSRDIITNNQKEYAKLSSLLVKGRMAGEVDWNIIEDRIRMPFIPYWVNDIPDAVQDTIDQYRLNRMMNQDVYIELWVEKDALSGVLKPITSYYHINLMVNRGYSSCSAMYDSYKRFSQHYGDKECHVLYLGDHDPSGLDMDRDIHDRLYEFGVDIEVERVALTSEQIRKYNPPSNPVKFTDSRADAYIVQFGKTSWEVDALNPKTLNTLIRSRINKLIDVDLFKQKIDDEEKDKRVLQAFSSKFNKK